MPTAPVTVTQGKGFTDTQGNQGIAQYDPNTGAKLGVGQSATVNPVAAPVPTKAPGINQPPNGTQAPAPAPIAKPVSTVSSSTAANHINGVMIPAMQQAQSDLATHNANITATKAAAAATPQAPQQSSSTPSDQTQPQSATDTAAAKIANTPDTGNRFLYDAQGNQIEMPVGSPIPAGYTATQPPPNPVSSNTPMVSHFMDSQGNTYAQYNNGTYGMTDSNGNYVGAIGAQEFQSAQSNSPDAQLQQARTQVASITQSLAAVANGSYPLTGPQQAQINGLQTSLNSDVAAQTAANANLTGGTTVAMNLYGMGSTIAGLSAIKATVDQGVQKVLELQTKAASASAAMLDSFQTENMTMMKASYDVYHSAMSDIQTNIDNMQKQVQQNKTDAQTQAHQQFQDFMTSENYTLTQKQDAFDNYVKQSQLTEQQKTDATDAWYKQQDIALRQQAQAAAAGGGGLGGLPSVSAAAGGGADPVAQAKFLAALPGGPTGTVATVVQKLANYQMNPADFTTSNRAAMGGLTKETAIALAEQYNPSYSDTNYPAAAKYMASLKSTSGNSTGANIAAVNTAINHFADFVDNVGKLGNGGVASGANAVGNTLKNWTYGSGFQASYKGAQNDQTALAEQLAKFYKGSGSADVASIDAFKKQLDPNQTPGALKGNVSSTVSLLTGQLDTAYSDYESALGTPPPAPGQPGSLITPAALASLKKLGVDTSVYAGQQPYNGTSDGDLINMAPGNDAGSSSDPSTFFSNL